MYTEINRHFPECFKLFRVVELIYGTMFLQLHFFRDNGLKGMKAYLEWPSKIPILVQAFERNSVYEPRCECAFHF